MTLADLLTAKLRRHQVRKARLVADVVAEQGQIDALQAALAAITQTDEDRYAQLVTLGVVKAED